MKNSFEDKLNKLRELHDKNSMIIDHEVDYIISKYGTERKIDLKKLKTYILIIFIINHYIHIIISLIFNYLLVQSPLYALSIS